MSEPYGRQERAQREAENRRPLGPDIDAEGRRMDGPRDDGPRPERYARSISPVAKGTARVRRTSEARRTAEGATSEARVGSA